LRVAVAASRQQLLRWSRARCRSVERKPHTIIELSGTCGPIARRLGTLNCNVVLSTDPNDRWCFNAFGATLGSRQSPSYAYKVAASTIVRAAAAGLVRRIEAETNPLYPGEFEVETRSSQNGTYLVSYDHVRNLRVALGSSTEVVRP